MAVFTSCIFKTSLISWIVSVSSGITSPACLSPFALSGVPCWSANITVFSARQLSRASFGTVWACFPRWTLCTRKWLQIQHLWPRMSAQSFPSGLFGVFWELISHFLLGASATPVNISAQSDGETSMLGRLVILIGVPLLTLSGSRLLQFLG